MKKSKKYSELRRVLAKQANSQHFLSPTGGPTRLSSLLYPAGPKPKWQNITSFPWPNKAKQPSAAARRPIPSVNQHVIWGDFELPAACSGGNR
jgi:hypothetical protein